MSRTRKTTTAAAPLVAAETILIEGKAFSRGEAVTGVSADELARAVSQRRVITKKAFDAQGEPAPDITAPTEADSEAQGETE